MLVAGVASSAVAILQFVLIQGGPHAYRFFGAPEQFAAFVAHEPGRVAVGGIVLAAIFGTFAAYAFSGAGLIRPLPWLLGALRVIGSVYLVRGSLFLLQLGELNESGLSRPRDVAYSLCSLAIGFAYLFGSRRVSIRLSAAS